MYFFKLFFKCFIIYISVFLVECGYQEKILKLNYKNREPRNCPLYGPHTLDQHKTYNIWIILALILLGLILLLLLLGIIKGLLGLCCFPPIGMWGLGVLIDLPRPLDRYQEKDLWHYPVEYDLIGWPVHPETKQRSVRAITKQSEFCLNVIFFLTYPVVMCVDIVSLCCFRTYDHDNDRQQCFEGINTVVFANCTGTKKKLIGKKREIRSCHVYADENDTAEEEDTQYVLKEMRKSEEQIKTQGYS